MQQLEPAHDRLSTQPVIPPTAIQQSSPAPMEQGLQAQSAPLPTQRNMPHGFGRTINFKVVFLVQPNEPKAAASVKAETAAPARAKEAKQ